ncbi:MAG TPA: M15 family metallopeptidase [Pseudolabrys sp.]|nr:M15 family metallopeptidase [Pseudolabrys sp.]
MRTLKAGFGFLAVLLALPAGAADSPPSGFVYLRDVDPSIAQDMRYAGSDNFTGHPLPGYGAPECVLRREVAQALARVQADLARKNLGLKVYDCYRPTRAVRAFARWAQQSDDGATKRFYPTMEKRTLFDGYIASHSAHSTGNAVDLTLVERPTPPAPPFDPRASYGACTAPADKRAPDNALDMGTGFDCFDPKSTALASTTTPEQNHRRVILLEAMRMRGFRNYFREWWHFSFGARGPAYDVPIEIRRAR